MLTVYKTQPLYVLLTVKDIRTDESDTLFDKLHGTILTSLLRFDRSTDWFAASRIERGLSRFILCESEG